MNDYARCPRCYLIRAGGGCLCEDKYILRRDQQTKAPERIERARWN